MKQTFAMVYLGSGHRFANVALGLCPPTRSFLSIWSTWYEITLGIESAPVANLFISLNIADWLALQYTNGRMAVILEAVAMTAKDSAYAVHPFHMQFRRHFNSNQSVAESTRLCLALLLSCVGSTRQATAHINKPET